MKDFKTIALCSTAKAYLSSEGYYGYWYYDLDMPVIIKEEACIKHLHLWKNQRPYLAFSIKASNIKKGLKADLGPDTNVCIWIHEQELLENMIKRKL